ncbi:NAD-P-binding protein [Stereum hirsutum FP-91666 SS1]|uniref:NAD-P-binding protein n=1 Tax=Stereum hirsutum (strain FP-91666) TaxID=721885 RepID=UPI000444935C|nr:NAD-P-binding protein [Stereum hirsutum FP-91666 SS1]EIM84215.1 NAD-P-binding protein [Stereum hirsutum FP-91666 SS1]
MSPQRTVFITGCSHGGIGHALALEYHAQGLRVVATARSLDAMQDLTELGLITMALDVTKIDAVRKVRDDVASLTGGKLDILVNNACVLRYTFAVTDMDMQRVRDLFEVNLFAPICMVQEFIRLLIASGDGRIVQIGSVSGIMPTPFGASYNASKAGLHAFSNTLRVELAPFRVKVLSVITGSVQSNIVKPVKMPETSMYLPMEDLFHSKRVNTSQENAMSADKYAKQVVAESLKVSPRACLWAGNKIWPCWIIDTFLGLSVFDWLFGRMFGLTEFSARLEKDKDKRL